MINNTYMSNISHSQKPIYPIYHLYKWEKMVHERWLKIGSFRVWKADTGRALRVVYGHENEYHTSMLYVVPHPFLFFPRPTCILCTCTNCYTHCKYRMYRILIFLTKKRKIVTHNTTNIVVCTKLNFWSFINAFFLYV